MEIDELPSSPRPANQSDVLASTAILELKVTKLKRALASCIERQNQLTEDNAKLRKMIDSSGSTGEVNRIMLGLYESKVAAFLAFLREEDPVLFALADDCLNKKLTSPDELSTKSALNHEMALVRERTRKLDTDRQEADRSIAAVASMTVNNATGTAPLDGTAPALPVPAAEPAPPRQTNQRRDALRPPRLKSTVDGVPLSPGALTDGQIQTIVARHTAEFQVELGKQADSIGLLKAELEKYRASEEQSKRSLAAIVVYQLKKSSASAKNASSLHVAPKVPWADAPDGLSPGPAVLQEAVSARLEDLMVTGNIRMATPGSTKAGVALPMMPRQQSKLVMRSRYGVFAEHQSQVHGPSSPSRHKGKSALRDGPDGDLLSTAMRSLDAQHDQKGFAFRLAVSAFLNDMGQLINRADRVCQRLEAAHDRLVEYRLSHSGQTGHSSVTSSGASGGAPKVAVGEALSIDELNSMADLVAADFDRDVPDSLRTNDTIRELLELDGTWSAEIQLLVLGRQTLVDYLQRRAEHWQTRVGNHLDVKHDPRKMQQLLRATANAAAVREQQQHEADDAAAAMKKAATPRANGKVPSDDTAKRKTAAAQAAAWTSR